MFTGIIEELGSVKSLEKTSAISKLLIFAPKIAPDTYLGQSICVNGSCLSVVEIEKDLLVFEIMQETLKRTNLGFLKDNDKVNLERALKVSGRIDGHFVSGHTDGTGIVRKRQRKGGDIAIEIETAEPILRYIVLKGSVALDGVSLTVSALEGGTFAVGLIPYTLKNTILGLKKERDIVNIECDILAKYIKKFLSQDKQSSTSKITSSFLKKQGFI